MDPAFQGEHDNQQLHRLPPDQQHVHEQPPYDDAIPVAEIDPLLSEGVAMNPTEMSSSLTLVKPYEGMMFDTLDEAGKYYEEYGRQNGFCTRIRSSDKTIQRSNEVTSRLYVCAREGKHESRCPTKGKRTGSTLRIGCPASLRVMFDRFVLKWKVTVFNDEHNHKPVTPCKRMKMKSNKNMPAVIKDLTVAFRREHLRVSKLPSIFGGANIGFDQRDCYNHLKDVRHKDLEMGDAQAVLSYFRQRQADNPQFFYSMQCDATGRATNFFWVDARSRMAYKYFGDVITFDTTYRTNKYAMPFAPFTGINHHWQSILFGCALLQDETEESFLWLFDTWLQAMGGNPPISIITDQDLAMKAAIQKNLEKRKRQCKSCLKFVRHDKRNCPLNKTRTHNINSEEEAEDEEEEDITLENEHP